MWRVLITFVAAALIIYLSYLFSKYVGKGVNKNSSSRYMRLLDQIAVGQDRHIAVIQVGGKYLLVGITAGQVNVLAELQDDELFPLSPESGESGTKAPDFKAIMGKLGEIGKKGR